ncbi:unnamed protein product [Bursaphelenchus okinawaensis]|uniref:Uncharacterized protein n=1 Tax=Bursaphelenchus okinawaensis TaxID=465554 RepID=A0A811L347_9BILA|nr:unnamed protein product [Bursaphelenchus okinawaensis]CAG9118124.1 unnamed protein product [Bursaphelenchus okinawaensis]
MYCIHISALLVGCAVLTGYATAFNADQLVKKCCTAESEQCCLQQLNKGETNDDCKAFKNHTICMEMELHKESLLAVKTENCCWLLESRTCRRQCVKMLRSIAIPPQIRIEKAMECSRKKVRSQRPQGCIEESLEKYEQCFPSCVMFQRLQQGNQMYEYAPARHCDIMKNIDNKNPCIVPDYMDA